MNVTMVHGIINGDAVVCCNPENKNDVPLVVFYVKDFGNHNCEPMVWQVKLKKKSAMNILSGLGNGKEVFVKGAVELKNYTTSFGEPRTRVTLIAEFVEFAGLAGNREVAA